jgi:hypothetical protein
MLGKSTRQLVLLTILVAVSYAVAAADSTLSTYDPQTGSQMTSPPEFRSVTKVKPEPPTVSKVSPYRGLSSGFGALSGYNPIAWGPECWLPVPAKGQFDVGARVFFPRIRGEVRRGTDTTGVGNPSVTFDDHLGLREYGNVVWSVEAFYQFRPRWGIKYSFTPLTLESTYAPDRGFNFMNQTFAAGTAVHTKWDRFAHRAGLVFDISRTPNSLTKVFAEWLYIQDKLTIGSALGGASTGTWDTHKSVAVVGLEFDKCLKNYRGNTLALTGRGGFAFLDDSIGYEAEAALNYLIPIKTGRFGYVKAGYRWETLKKEKTFSLFSTTMDGAFLQLGFLF